MKKATKQRDPVADFTHIDNATKLYMLDDSNDDNFQIKENR